MVKGFDGNRKCIACFYNWVAGKLICTQVRELVTFAHAVWVIIGCPSGARILLLFHLHCMSLVGYGNCIARRISMAGKPLFFGKRARISLYALNLEAKQQCTYTRLGDPSAC
jgi:hypothetical protein